MIPVALTIAGSDSGGGAGLQADLKTFASLGVHGTSVVTCLTAQTPRRVRSIQPCNVQLMHQQLEAVFEELRPAAIKTGMLYSAPIVRTVTSFLNRRLKLRAPPLVVDPVMISASGTRLLKPGAIKLLCAELLPLATLVTPNLHEAEVLVGRSLRSLQDLRAAARELRWRFGCAALVKGGHLRGLREAADIFYDGRTELLLAAPFVRGIRTHGTGCTYSAAITAYLTRGLPLPEAVSRAKEYITQAIAQSQAAAGHAVLNSFWR
ncbi:MAG TPA: bifunctional hydroxymethylpyrimidine kinase/phosphomethylpyrimidine kinase [Candidatus Binatia bacterium]|jgi:hydroxymethylpyrimidine kinase/phosphomethylpyrimidine kinase|nr:bifunctional hydroxymethylpyrimidine kinase/phosphomethylpyrimidine kinase [Candidatus Binatia bacterium]